MKTTCAAFLALGLLASSVDAALLRLAWAEDDMSQTLAVAPHGQATVNVYVDTMLADQVGTVYFSFASDPADNLSMDHTDTLAMAGWVAGGQSGTLGGLAQFAVADAIGANPIGGDGVSHLVGSFVVQNDNLIGDDLGKDILANAFADQGVLDPSGAPLTWDLRYVGSYSGYVAFGDWGGAAWDPAGGMCPGQPANPLILISESGDGGGGGDDGPPIPEPAAVVLLAFGSFALLRRH